MDQVNDPNYIENPSTMPVKRKRGRPRKDKSLKNRMDITPSLNYPPPPNSARDANSCLVGQPVTGVIEASFGAGFLLNVNIGNSGTCLRGVVFKPGHCLPISPENDVAPHIQMINRHEIPLPAENQNREYIRSVDGIGNEQRLHNDVARPVAVEPVSLPNGSCQYPENSESVQINKNGNLMPNEGNNKYVEISSQSLDRHLANGDSRNKPLDFEPLPYMDTVNNINQFQGSSGPFNNGRMGPMSMLLQVVQEKMVKPGNSS